MDLDDFNAAFIYYFDLANVTRLVGKINHERIETKVRCLEDGLHMKTWMFITTPKTFLPQ